MPCSCHHFCFCLCFLEALNPPLLTKLTKLFLGWAETETGTEAKTGAQNQCFSQATPPYIYLLFNDLLAKYGKQLVSGKWLQQKHCPKHTWGEADAHDSLRMALQDVLLLNLSSTMVQRQASGCYSRRVLVYNSPDKLQPEQSIFNAIHAIHSLAVSFFQIPMHTTLRLKPRLKLRLQSCVTSRSVLKWLKQLVALITA